MNFDNMKLNFADILPIRGCDLRIMRAWSGLTTMQMAKAAGVRTRKTYENWEKDMGSPSINQFFQMAEACGFDLNGYVFFHTLKEHRRIRARQAKNTTIF